MGDETKNLEKDKLSIPVGITGVQIEDDKSKKRYKISLIVDEVEGTITLAEKSAWKFPIVKNQFLIEFHKPPIFSGDDWIRELSEALKTVKPAKEDPSSQDTTASPKKELSDEERLFGPLARQREYLDKLHAINDHKEPILVKALEGTTPEGGDFDLYGWRRYQPIWNKLENPIWTRGILKNELMLDPDVKDWNILKQEMDKIQKFCQADNIPLQLAYSGGNGVHGHIFFTYELPDEAKEIIKTYDVDVFEFLRNALVNIILKESGTSRELLHIDSKKITFSASKKGSQVREYGTLRPNGNFKTLIQTIPDKKPEVGSLPLVFPDKIEIWNVPEKYRTVLAEELSDELERMKSQENYNTTDFDFAGSELEKDFPCIKQILKNGATEGQRYYGALSIGLMGKRCNYPWTKLDELTKPFLKKCGHTESGIKSGVAGVKRAYDSGDTHFSCRKMKETFGENICSFDKCKVMDKVYSKKKPVKEEIPPHIQEAAEKILKEGKPLDYILNVYNKLHVGDRLTGMTICASIACQSVKNTAGIQPKVSGDSGKGKSHAVSSVLHLVPKSEVLESSLSDKAAYYLQLKPGTIIFSDDVVVSENLQGLIKRATTKFQEQTIHTVVLKRDGELVPVSLPIPERIVWLLTSVNDDGGMEYLNRQFNLGVDESGHQDINVMKHTLERAVTAKVEFPITDEVLICRAIFADLKKRNFLVAIPYAERILWVDMHNRRNLSQFLDFIMAFTVFNYKNRKSPSKGVIEASEEDFYSALSLYTPRAINQKTKLNDREMSILSKMETDQPYTMPELVQLTALPYKTVYSHFHGRPGGSGLLDKISQLEYRKENEYEKGPDGDTIKTKPKNMYVLTKDYKEVFREKLVAKLLDTKITDLPPQEPENYEPPRPEKTQPQEKQEKPIEKTQEQKKKKEKKVSPKATSKPFPDGNIWGGKAPGSE
jgi:hypothetical protein